MTKNLRKWTNRISAALVTLLPMSLLAAGIAVDQNRDLAYHSAVLSDPAIIVQDISDPTAPVQLASIASPNHAKNLSMDNKRNLLFVSLGNEGLQVVDVSDPASPQAVGFWNDKSWDVAVQDGVAYVARNDRYFDILDVSDSNNIQLIERVTYTVFDPFDGPRTTVSEINNNRLWIGGTPNDLNVFEISAPGVLNRIHIGINYTSSLNTRSIVFDGDISVHTNGNLLLNDANTRKEIGRLTRNDGAVVAAKNGYAFTVSTEEFIVYDISVPSSITEAQRILRPTAGFLSAFGAKGDLAFVLLSSSNDSAFQIFDISQILSPQLLANVSAMTDGGDGGITEPVNFSPIADAGRDQVAISRETVILNGSNSSDSDGNIASYQWKQVLGKSVSLSNANTAIPSFVAPRLRRKEDGDRFVFQLTVTDDRGAVDFDLVNVFIYRK